MRFALIILLSVVSVGPAMGAKVYRCQGDGGETVFSDEPCSDDAEAVNVEPAPTTETGNPGGGPEPNAEASGGDGDGEAKEASAPDGESSGQTDDGSTANAESADEAETRAETSDDKADPSNPCLKTAGEKPKVMESGVSEARIRAACGDPQRVTSERDLFDRTLHYTSGERSVRIFIRNGEKVGHTTN